jgi:ribose transport system permease protein
MTEKIKQYTGNNRWIWAAFGAVLLWLAMGISSGRLNAGSFLANVYAASFLAILAFGQMLVVTSGRGAIDLSIPGVLTFNAFVSMSIINGQNVNIPLAVGAVVSISIIVGILNALLVIYLKIPAIIATMAMNYILTTAALLINKNFSIFAIAPAIAFITRGKVLGIQVMIILVTALTVGLWFLMNKVTYGRALRAIGQNIDAARLAGVNVVRVEMLAYVASSVLAGIGGMFIAARVGGALLGMGNSYLLETIGSIVIGGTLISGGRANVIGTFVGCIFLGFLVTAMQIMGFSVGAQNIAKGIMIVAILIVGVEKTGEKRATDKRITAAFVKK